MKMNERKNRKERKKKYNWKLIKRMKEKQKAIDIIENEKKERRNSIENEWKERKTKNEKVRNRFENEWKKKKYTWKLK